MKTHRHPAGPVILAHGGAGPRPLTRNQHECLRHALVTGSTVLHGGGPAIDAVEKAIRMLESSGLFNAGAGSRLQLDGVRRMDAALMEGQDLRAGAVAGIEQVCHPISAARLVMDKTSHVLLAGPPATRFARHFKLERQAAPTPMQLRKIRAVARAIGRQRDTVKLYAEMPREETVGAVALDHHGDLAAGASTGGIAFMLPGRVGDTPLIGCGVYADNEKGAVSMTGIGESIIRLTLAKNIVDRLGPDVRISSAVRLALNLLVRRIGTPRETSAGALALARTGHFAIRHTSPYMAGGHCAGKGPTSVADRFP
jgi:L-asparaginase / beta-aspartyl-peptidase